MLRLTNYLAAQAEQGAIKLNNPAIATESFISMVLGDYYPRVLLGIKAVLNPEHIKCHINTTVQFF
ncbi:MAG: TetR/AcrR family transcriptional regulator C-terminal domain-containing protein [Cyanobacteria bacterium J06626_18]